MRAATHVIAIVLGLAAPTALTFWSVSDSGPRNAAHYARVAAERTDTRAVLERLAAAEFAEPGTEVVAIIADGENGAIHWRRDGAEGVDLFIVVDGEVTSRSTMAPPPAEAPAPDAS